MSCRKSENKRKIAILLSSVPSAGGGHQYAMLLAECLKELSVQYFELIIFCTNKFWRGWCRNNGVRYYMIGEIKAIHMEFNSKFPILSHIYNSYKTELGKIVRQEKIDVLFISMQSYFPNLNTKIIAPVHDLMHRYEPEFSEVSEGYQFREQMSKCQARYAECLLMDSQIGKKQFIESYGKYMKKNRPYLVNLPFVVPPYIIETTEEYINVPEKYIFYPAQFWKHKNHINLIKAIQLLTGNIRDIHLVLVGSEKNCLKEIKKYIVDNKLEKNITILGFVNNGNMVYLYKHAIAMVMPSYFGPTNIPPLEAMAAGCPVIVANKYAMPEQVGDAGLVFDPDSPEEIAGCIKRVWIDDGLRKEMIEKGYQRIIGWDKKRFRHRIFKIIKRCFDKD